MVAILFPCPYIGTYTYYIYMDTHTHIYIYKCTHIHVCICLYIYITPRHPLPTTKASTVKQCCSTSTFEGPYGSISVDMGHHRPPTSRSPATSPGIEVWRISAVIISPYRPQFLMAQSIPRPHWSYSGAFIHPYKGIKPFIHVHSRRRMQSREPGCGIYGIRISI